MSSHYSLKLEQLTSELMIGLKEVNEKYNTAHGFIGLLVRDSSYGNIDIMHNCTNPKDLIKILKLTIEQLEK